MANVKTKLFETSKVKITDVSSIIDEIDEYRHISSLGNDMFIATTKDFKHFILLDSDFKKVIIKNSIIPFKEDIFIFGEEIEGNRLYGFMNKEGKEIIPAKYTDISCDYGIAVAKKSNHYEKKIINKPGTDEKEIRCYDIRILSDDRLFIEEYVKRYLSDNKGNTIALLENIEEYSGCEKFKDGLLRVKERIDQGEYKIVFINKNGIKVIETDYEDVSEFNEGLAYFKKDGLFGFINKEGKEVIEPKYDEVSNFYKGVAVFIRDYASGILNKKGEEIVKPKYDEIMHNKYGLMNVKRNGLYGIINTDGKEIVEPKYDRIYVYSDDLALVKKNGKYGYIDKNGNEVIKPIYFYAESFKNGIAAIEEDGRIYFINKKLENVVNKSFDHVREFDYGFAIAEDKENVFLINFNKDKNYKVSIDISGRIIEKEFESLEKAQKFESRMKKYIDKISPKNEKMEKKFNKIIEDYNKKLEDVNKTYQDELINEVENCYKSMI